VLEEVGEARTNRGAGDAGPAGDDRVGAAEVGAPCSESFIRCNSQRRQQDMHKPDLSMDRARSIDTLR
jgi:hypothetical protein